jgi:hypothetical protein
MGTDTTKLVEVDSTAAVVVATVEAATVEVAMAEATVINKMTDVKVATIESQRIITVSHITPPQANTRIKVQVYQ